MNSMEVNCHERETSLSHLSLWLPSPHLGLLHALAVLMSSSLRSPVEPMVL